MRLARSVLPADLDAQTLTIEQYRALSDDDLRQILADEYGEARASEEIAPVRRLPRPCLSCGQPTTNASRCPACDKANWQAAYGGQWRKASDAQRRRVSWCECQGCSLHTGQCGAREDLTTDHLVPHANGGTMSDGVRTLCRRCNSARRDRAANP